MNDEIEQFERRLQAQPVKKIPAGWRTEILTAAMSQASSAGSRVQELPWHSIVVARLSSIFWPHPKAWAGLAAVWVCILLLNFSNHERPHFIAEKTSSAPPPEMVAELKQQRLMFAELIGATEPRVAGRQKNYSPKPQSKRMEIFTV
ncbi:MAG TPA: hypothetical protein VK742_16525 [Candidatus Sulfotelmatobacter sp.]|jgi:hypothetical protein|nr:hypothetical protein [Candidatus Sulfotelmatobacter sp.]